MSDTYDSSNLISYNSIINNDTVQNIEYDVTNKDNAFNSLGEIEDYTTNYLNKSDLSVDKKNSALDRLDNVNKAKQDMLQELDNNVSLFVDRFNNTNTNKINQQANLNIVNEELKRTKEKSELYHGEINNKMRNVQINTFYQKKYNSEISLLKFIIMVCIVLISISFTKRIGYFSDAAYSLLVGIIIFFGLVRTLYLIYDIIIRDKTNFDEIDNSYALDIYSSNGENDNGDDVEETTSNCPNTLKVDSLNFGDELDIDTSSYNSTYNMFS